MAFVLQTTTWTDSTPGTFVCGTIKQTRGVGWHIFLWNVKNMTKHISSTPVGDEERAQVCCVSQTMKPTKWSRHFKPVFQKNKLLNSCAQQSHLIKAASVPGNAQLAPFRGASRVARCKKPHTVSIELKPPSATHTVWNRTDEATASKVKVKWKLFLRQTIQGRFQLFHSSNQ